MGVFIAQALTVMLGLSVVLLSLILLGMVASAARKRELRAARIVLQPARAERDETDCVMRSAIEVGQAAPSRAPPPFDPRARLEKSPEPSAA